MFSVRWGALAWFGPLAVAPEVQGLGIAQQLVDAVHARWRRARVRLWGLETMADSPLHLHLYGKLGYLPLSAVVGFVADAAPSPTNGRSHASGPRRGPSRACAGAPAPRGLS